MKTQTGKNEIFVFLVLYNYTTIPQTKFFFCRGPAEKQVMVPVEENIESAEDETYGCISGEATRHLSSEDITIMETIKRTKGIQVSPRTCWPKRGVEPISEYSNDPIFCYAFPWLFPGGVGDINEARQHKIEVADWAENLLYYEDGRFCADKQWCFFTLNYVYRRRNQGQSRFFVDKFIGELPPTIQEVQDRIEKQDTSFIDKLMYFSKNVPNSTGYWRHKKAELYSWINHHIEYGRGPPTVFMTLSCAEYFWPDLKRLLEQTILRNENKIVDLDTDRNILNKAINDHTIVVQQYFHIRVDSFLKTVGKHVFGIKHYWARFEFAKSRGQIHLHLLGILEDNKNFHDMWNLEGQKEKQEQMLGKWAEQMFNMTAELPYPAEITANAKCPCTERFSQIATSRKLDELLLCNLCQMHKCNGFCLRNQDTTKKENQLQQHQTEKQKIKRRKCRSGFGVEETPNTGDTPGWPLQDKTTISSDQRGFDELCMKRNNSRLNQTSLYCLQSWRANCDMKILLYKTNPSKPDMSEIARVSDYIVGYCCKGNNTQAIERKTVKDFIMR